MRSGSPSTPVWLPRNTGEEPNQPLSLCARQDTNPRPAANPKIGELPARGSVRRSRARGQVLMRRASHQGYQGLRRSSAGPRSTPRAQVSRDRDLSLTSREIPRMTVRSVASKIGPLTRPAALSLTWVNDLRPDRDSNAGPTANPKIGELPARGSVWRSGARGQVLMRRA